EFTAKRNEWLSSRKQLLGIGAKAASVIITPTGIERVLIAGKTEDVPAYDGNGVRVERSADWVLDVTGVRGAAGSDVEAPSGVGAPGVLGSDDEAVRFGSAFHRLMEVIDLGGGVDLGSLSASVASEYGLGSKAGELESLAHRALSSDLLKGAARSSRVYREAPFTVPLDSLFPGDRHAAGCYLEGRIDLVFEIDGQWTAVDYKTDDVSGEVLDERFRGYRAQGELYVTALHRLGIDLGGGVIFYFVRPGEKRVIEATKEIVEHAEGLIRSYILSGQDL
ncbi:MAG: PD-(D/E)XK nuclease family protein, partial [Candidatus Krumholzibacteria bacterium]|nr:PD-(D/E)XK nuclease family protein [Candidatus Krumholzibacteria bacterium]